MRATQNPQLQLASTCLLTLQQQPILLLKIDTEGYEQSVLEGLSSLLESRQVAGPCSFFLLMIIDFWHHPALSPRESHGPSNIIIFAGAEYYRRAQSAQPC